MSRRRVWTYVSNKYFHLPKGAMEYGDTPSSLANIPVSTRDIRRFSIERVRRDGSANDWPFCEESQTSTQCTT